MTQHHDGDGSVKREQLFKAGGFMALPFEIARRKDLTWNAKGVWQCLAFHLGPTNSMAWPSLTMIATETGMSRRTVQNAIEQLTAAGLVEAVPPKPGETMKLPSGKVVPATTKYRLYQPQATLFDEDEQGEQDEANGPDEQDETGQGYSKNCAMAKSALGQNFPGAIANFAHEVLKRTKQQGARAAAADSATNSTTNNGNGGDGEIVKTICRAYGLNSGSLHGTDRAVLAEALEECRRRGRVGPTPRDVAYFRQVCRTLSEQAAAGSAGNRSRASPQERQRLNAELLARASARVDELAAMEKAGGSRR